MKASYVTRLLLGLIILLLVSSFGAISYGEAPWTIGPASQIGGWRDAIDVQGNYAYINEGFSIRVFDVSGDQPQLKGSLQLPYEPSYLKVSGNYLYASMAYQTGILFVIVDITDPTSPKLQGSCSLSGADAWSAGRIGFYGNYAYVTGGSYSKKLFVVDISNKQAPQLKSTISLPAKSIAVNNGKAYVVGGSEFNIFDVAANPSNPTITTTPIKNVVGDNDITTSGDYVYIAGPQKFQIIDVKDPKLPADKGSHTVTYVSSINTINIYNNKAYISLYEWSDSAFKGINIFDLSNMLKPTKEGEYAVNSVASKLSYPFIYIISYDTNAITKLDISNPQSISKKGSFESVMLANSVAAIGDVLYMSTDDAVSMYDVKDAKNPTLIGSAPKLNYYSLSSDSSKLYGLGTNYLHILNVKDKTTLSLSGFYTRTTSEVHQSLKISGGYAFIKWGDWQYSEGLGIDIVPVGGSGELTKSSTVKPEGTAIKITAYEISAGYLYIGYKSGTSTPEYKVEIYNLSNISSPTKTATIALDSNINALAVVGSTLFIARVNKIAAYDISDKSNPKLEKELSTNVTPILINTISIPDNPEIGTILLINGYEVLQLKSSEISSYGAYALFGYAPGTVKGGVFTFSYSKGIYTEGPVCEGPSYVEGMVTVPTSSGSGSYMVISNASSYGTYIQLLTPKAQNKAQLTMQISPSEAAADGCTTDPGVGVHTYDKNQNVQISAQAKSPWNFKEWTGDASGTSPQANITMDKDKIATANFVKPVLTLGPGPQNPSCYKFGKGQKNVIAISIVTAVNDVDDWILTSLQFKATGSGDELKDIQEARLYMGSLDGTLIGKTKYSADNGSISFGVGKTIPKGQSLTFILVYDFDETKACPCKNYSTKITVQEVVASPINYANYQKLPTPPNGVTGFVEAKSGHLLIDETTNKQGAKKLNQLEKPLRVSVENISDDCLNWFKVKFYVDPSTTPKGSTGYKFSNGATIYEAEINAKKEAEAKFTVGSLIGLYYVYATLETKPGYPYGCQCTESVPIQAFQTFTTGVNVSAQFDGDETDTLGTFITNIEAQNKLTASVTLPPNDPRKVVKMTFNLDGDIKEDTSEPFEATYDMSKLKEASNLYVKAELNDGSIMEDNYPFFAIPFPDWLNFVNNEKIQTYIKWEFQPNEKRYRISFSWPGDFIWNKPIESHIPLIGGEENEAKASFTVAADYYIDQKTGLHGSGTVNSEILGKPFNVNGSVDAQFDKNFELLPGATAKLAGSIDFELPEKTLASKTILVYGVPVTLAIDLGGNVKVFVNGAVVFDEKFAFQKMTFIPGTTITLDITASASVAFGLAKIGVKGSPTGTLSIKLSYTTASGIKQEAFGGQIEIPITLFGSLGWGLVSGELGSTTLGPYTFGDEVGELKALLLADNKVSGKHFYSTSHVAIDKDGRKLLVWTKDISTSSTEINPEVAYLIDKGSGFLPAGLITNNSFFELDPKAVFLSDGKALAAWTCNNGPKTLSNLKDLFNHQNIAYSLYDGTNWSPESLLIDDQKADGNPELAFDSSINKVALLWVHNTKDDPMDKSGYAIYNSIYDPLSKTWTDPSPIPNTDDTAADYMPTVTSNNKGKFLAVWVRDNDGEYFTELKEVQKGSSADTTNKDNNLYYSVFENGNWSQPGKITSDDDYTELMPNLTATKDGNFALVWVKKVGTTDKLMFAVYNTQTGSWSNISEVESAPLIEDPKISIDANNKVTILYRKNTGKVDAIYSIEKQLVNNSLQSIGLYAESEPQSKRITYAKEPNMWLSAALGPDGKMIIASTAVSKEIVSPPTIGDNITFGVADQVPKASLTKEYSEEATGSPKYTSLKANIGIKVDTKSKFIVRGVLHSTNGNLIEEVESDIKELDVGNQTVSLVFSGRKIAGTNIDGPFVIKDIVLLDATLSPIAIGFDSAGFQTKAYKKDDFAPPRLIADKQVYIDTKESMKIKVLDENKTGSVIVQVKSSAMTAPIAVTLTPTTAGVFEGQLKFSETSSAADTIKVEEGGIITLKYLDSSNQEWQSAVMWEKTPVDLMKSNEIKIDQSWNLKSSTLGIDLDSYFKGSAFVSIWKWKDNTWAVRLPNQSDKGTAYANAKGFTLLTNIEPGEGFWVNSNYSTKVLVKGTEGTGGVSIGKGWNLVGLKGNQPYEIGTLLGTNSKYVISVWKWENGNWSVYLPGNEDKGASYASAKGFYLMGEIKPGEGFWVNATEGFKIE